MGQAYRLLRGKHRSRSGERYVAGDVFSPTPDEIALLRRRIRPVEPEPALAEAEDFVCDEGPEPPALDIGIVTSIFGDYGKFLPEWAGTICELERKPALVTVAVSGPTPNDAPGIWRGRCVPQFEAAGIPHQIVTLPEHVSMGRTRNEAVRHTHTEWIMHLDADDALLPHCLDDVARLAPRADVVSLGSRYEGLRENRPDKLFLGVGDPAHGRPGAPNAEKALAGLQVATSKCPYRRWLWELMPYIETSDFCDSPLWVGFAHLGARFVGTRRACGIYRTRPESHNFTRSATERRAARKRTMRLCRDPQYFRKQLLRPLREVTGVDLADQLRSGEWWTIVQRLQTTPAIVLADSGSGRYGQVHSTAVIEGPVYVAEGAKVDAFALVEGPAYIGPGCVVGSYAKIRAGTHLERDVLVGSYAEVKASVIRAGAKIGPQCYLGDCVVDEEAFLGAVVRSCNVMLEPGRTVRAKGAACDLVDTGMERLGCLVGAGAKVGVLTAILPGRAIPAGETVLPHSVWRG